MSTLKTAKRGRYIYYELWDKHKFVKHIGNKAKLDKYLKDIGKKERELANLKGEKIPTPDMPEGKFDVLLADPPWLYDFSATDSREIENQYPTLPLETIKALKVPSADNAVLYLWATAPKLVEALEVMKSWGFDYRTSVVWDKEIIGMGYWARGQHELLLIGVKGNFSPPPETLRVSSIIRSHRENHSKKPDFLYDLLELQFPEGRFLELFARGNNREKWIAWGHGQL